MSLKKFVHWLIHVSEVAQKRPEMKYKIMGLEQ